MGDERDPRVDAGIEPLREWQRVVCRRGREIVLGVDAEGLADLFAQIVAHDRAGGWRRI